MEEAVSANTGGAAVGVRSAEGQVFVSMGGGAVHARSAEEAASVSTGGDAVDARSVEEAVSASMGGDVVGVKIAKVCTQTLNAAYDQHTPCLLQVKLLLVANHWLVTRTCNQLSTQTQIKRIAHHPNMRCF